VIRISTLGILMIVASLIPIFQPSPFFLYLWLFLGTIILGIALIIIGSEIEVIRGEVDDLSDEVMTLKKKLREVSK
jgi:hypothetical protein